MIMRDKTPNLIPNDLNSSLGSEGKTYSNPSSSGHSGGGSRPGQTHKKPKNLYACDEKEPWHAPVPRPKNFNLNSPACCPCLLWFSLFCLLKEVNRELQRIHVDGCQYNHFDERLNAKTEGSKRLTYTGLRVGIIVSLVTGLVVTSEVRDLVRRGRKQRTWGCVGWVYAIVWSVSVGWVPVWMRCGTRRSWRKGVSVAKETHELVYILYRGEWSLGGFRFELLFIIKR